MSTLFCSRLSELVGSPVGLLANMPVAVGKDPLEPPLMDNRWRCEGLVGAALCGAGETPSVCAGDIAPPSCGIWIGFAPALLAACGTISGFGMVVPTDCFGARPAFESA